MLLGIGVWYVFFYKSTNSLVNPLSIQNKKAEPSETLKEYSDPSGFSFSYPDNLSLNTKESDETTYADLLLSSKDVSGSLSLKISDSKYKTLDEWTKLNRAAASGDPKEVKLGNLKALEITTADRLILGALDQGIFFNIEMPLIEKDFWMKVYTEVLANFSFSVSEQTQASGGSDVSFEGEEVVEWCMINKWIG